MDAAKAFDSVLRHKVIEIMHEKNVNSTIVNAIANLLDETFMQVDGNTFETYVGVP